MFKSIGFIGTGNMGSAVATAAVKSGRAESILLANKTMAKAEKVAAELKASGTAMEIRTAANSEIAQKCDLIFLGVKPQMMTDMLAGIQTELAERDDRFVLCTMAAGLTCEHIAELAGGTYPVLRIMPNTPASIGHGVIQYCGKNVSEEELSELQTILTPAGQVVRVEERLIDAASAVSGCGPAFAYMFAEALADGGVACGLPRAQALTFAAGMLEGAAELLLESGKHPGELKDAVCSPGGSTIQGVRKLEEAGFRGAVIDAVIAAYEKTLSFK